MEFVQRFDAKAVRLHFAGDDLRGVFDIRKRLCIKCCRRRINESSETIDELFCGHRFPV